MTTKITLNNIADTALATLTGPKVTTIVYPGTETATDVAGGATINLTGAGFQSGCSVLVASTASSVVTFISSTQISFIAPALAAGTYVIYVINPDGGTAISIPGVSYSGTPNWTTTAGSLGSAYETGAISATLTATGDAPITYTLASGTLPTGSTLASNGTLSGTAVATASATTYTFAVTAKDAQNQTTNRSFSLTINPDVVTWVSPADSTTYTVAKDTAISNVTMSATSAAGGSITYTADTLPTGLSITGANIAGTPTIAANTSTTLTATSTATRAATRTINWVVNVGNDPYFEYNTLLIPGASTTFVDDASTNNFAVTINGDTKPNSFNPYTPGYYSNYFDGTGDYLSVPASSALSFAGDFTIECWVNTSTISLDPYGRRIWSFGSGSAFYLDALFYDGSSITSNVCIQIASVGIVISGTIPTANGQWNHVALTRSGSSMKLFVNGIQSGSTYTNSSAFTAGASNGIFLGCLGVGVGGFLLGNISNFRVLNGTAAYTANFTPSTTPVTAITNTSLLTCQSNRFIDNSTNNFTLTVNGNTTVNSFDPFIPNSSYSSYGSGYFDGTGDYLSVPYNSALNLGSDTTWTMEYWVYFNASLGTYTPISHQQDPTVRWCVEHNASTTLLVFDNSTGTTFTNPSTLAPNTWYHIAFVRDGTTVRLYINGAVSVTTTTSNLSNITSGPLSIGRNEFGGAYFFYMNGYIADVRLVKGTSVYTSAFAPPTAPLTAISGTSLLTLQNNQPVNNSTFLDNSTNNFLVTRAGNATQGTFSPYGGNWSASLNGTTDYLSTPYNTAFDFNTGNFTVECWFNHTGASFDNYPMLFGLATGASSGRSYYFYIDPSGFLNFGMYPDGVTVTLLTATTACTRNVWNHTALVRSSGTTKIYLNGVVVATAANQNFQPYLNAGSFFNIGREASFNGSYFPGYISNFRIVKGTALYTTTFTPPTTPLTPITNTVLLTCQSSRFIDNSINNFTITKGGDTSVQRFSPFNPSSLTPTSYSGYFDGTGDYVSAPYSAGGQLGSNNFTIEFWAYFSSVASGQQLLSAYQSGSTTNYALYTASTGTLNYYLSSNGSTWNIASGVSFGNISVNTWIHVALVRNGSTFTPYLNGVAGTTSTSASAIYTNTSPTIIGAAVNPTVNSPFTGYISNLRIVNGTAVYTATFTPPTSPLTAIANTSLLTLQSPTFIDNSTNNFTITAFGNSQPTQQNPFGFTSTTTNGYTPSTIGGSGYFDGSGDHLIFGSSYLPTVAGTAFTLEFWIYSTKVISTYTSIIASGNMQLNLSDGAFTGQIRFDLPTGVSNVLNSGDVRVKANTWNHIVLTRTIGNNYTLYLNGVNVGTGSSGTAITTLSTFAYSSTNSVLGYISDLRVTNSLVYTANFVPPTAPLTAVQNSSLLLNMTGAGIYDAAMMNNMETVGDAKLSTAVSKFGGSSMYFDGTGDYLSFPSNTVYAIGATEDYTVECWVNFSTVQTCAFWQTTNNTSSANGPFWFGYEAGALKASRHGSGSYAVSYTWSPSTSTWYHVAATRASGTVKLFVNGAVVATSSAQNGIDFTQSGGAVGMLTTPAYLVGYLDDLRFTKGYARYTSNFTAPTSEFKTF